MKTCSLLTGAWGLCALALLSSLAAPPTARAADRRAVARVTQATTGLSDASSVVATRACGLPTATRAACLAEVLTLRGTHSFVHPHLQRPASPDRLGRSRASGARAASAVPAAPTPQPGTPAYLQQAYDLTYLSQTAGPGATIAIVDAFDAPNAEADLATYRSTFGLPPCTTANGCFTKVDQHGGTGYPPVDPGWELEISLDLDAASALCPNCHIVLVEANTDQARDLAVAQAEADTFSPAVISDSWGVQLSGPATAAQFERVGTWTFPQSVTVAATGDFGYLGAGTDTYPAALANVIAVGGTTLVPASESGVQSARDFNEFAWSGTGSGCDQQVSKPAWQTDQGCTGRAYSDLSADADPDTGMQIYDADDGGWVVIGGTSAATPLAAAYYALQGAPARASDWAYQNAALFNDPSSGSNGSCAASIFYICDAGPGYDGPTGVGSISGATQNGAPGIGGPGPNNSYVVTATLNSVQLSGGVYPNGAATRYWWEYGTSTAYGQQTPTVDIGGGNAPVSVSDTLGGLDPNITYHYRLVAQNSYGTEYGYDFTLNTANITGATQTSGQNGSPAPGSSTTATPVPGGSSGAGGASSAPALGRVHVTSIGATSATVAATVTTGGTATTYSLVYGTTRGHLNRRLSGAIAASSTARQARVTWVLRRLKPGAIYAFHVVMANAHGSTASRVLRFRTSPVTITALAVRDGRLGVVLRCHGAAGCRVRLQDRAGSRLIAAGRATIRGNRSATVTLRLGPSFRAATGRGRHGVARLFVLSSWHGQQAVVSATL